MALLRSQVEKSTLGKFSSFQSYADMTKQIVERITMSNRLMKLLYYTERQALQMGQLSQQQRLEVIKNQITLIPKIDVSKVIKPMICISPSYFKAFSEDNRYFTIEIVIVSPYSSWALDGYQNRVLAIAGEIDAIINNSYRNYGPATFIDCKVQPLSNEVGSAILTYAFESYVDDIVLHEENV